jgi:hypothetical protein
LLADTRDENSLSSRLRARRDVKLRALIARVHAERGAVRILDMGGTIDYWKRLGFEFLRESHATVTVVNLVATEINPDIADPAIFTTTVGDACALTDIGDGEFDLAHSNSVIEHVETWGNMKRFAAETRRVAPYYYVQTPYFWFPIDPHYYRFPMIHWLPRPTRASILRTFPVAYSGRIGSIDSAYQVVDAARLLDRKQFGFLFPDAKIAFERFGGLAKSLLAERGPT